MEEHGELACYRDDTRWYDPEVGRFLAVDPLLPSLADPQSHNAYSYVNNDPVNLVGRGLRSSPPAMGPLPLASSAVGPKYKRPVFSKIEVSGFALSISHGPVSTEEPGVVRRGVPARSKRAFRGVVNGFATFASMRSRCRSLMKSMTSESRLFSTISPCRTPCSFGKAVASNGCSPCQKQSEPSSRSSMRILFPRAARAASFGSRTYSARL
jgi:RHS repeat-associated protein